MISGLLTLLELGALTWAERRWPLRPRVEPRARRFLRNLALASLSGLVVGGVERPIVTRLSARVERRRFGLLRWLRLPRGVEVALGVALMDYTLYVWHVLTHEVPVLWRLHRIHHADLDLDASTALRFHFLEMVLSVPWRAAQVGLLGITPRTLSIWQSVLMLNILFHHSNVRLPAAAEALLCRFIMTPRLHGIHHSADLGEQNSNWSSGLTLWDWLHGTLRFDRPQTAIRIGVEEWVRPEQVKLRNLIIP